MGELKNGKASGKDEVTGEMVKGAGDRGTGSGFENGVVPEDWRSAVTFPLYKGKGERTEWKNYRGISQLS